MPSSSSTQHSHLIDRNSFVPTVYKLAFLPEVNSLPETVVSFPFANIQLPAAPSVSGDLEALGVPASTIKSIIHVYEQHVSELGVVTRAEISKTIERESRHGIPSHNVPDLMPKIQRPPMDQIIRKSYFLPGISYINLGQVFVVFTLDAINSVCDCVYLYDSLILHFGK